jgi:anthraniloyl-CoA monooxygenase
MKIHVVGGGPAGLYFSLLTKKRDPAIDVTVFERDGPDDTFGWGIVFSDRTLADLEAQDRESCEAIRRKFVTWDNVDVLHRDRKITIRGNRFAGIGRLAFLQVLHRRCAEVGVELRFRANVAEGDLERLRACDLLVGADGARSLVRSRFAEAFGPTVDVRRNKYIWLGTPRLFHGLTLAIRPHEAGAFVAHAYEFDASTSTFIVECAEPTWSRAGFASMGEEETCATLAAIFRRELEGKPLLSNNFVRWLSFPIVKNRRWHHENVVLLGDALHTAHFSIGSGTKLALEDAIALARALEAHPRIADALPAFERDRKPAIDAYQAAAQASLSWFERVDEKVDVDPIPLAYELMTRSDRIDYEKLKRRDPEFVAAYDRWRAERGAEAGA